jgi:hypothetical protein
MLSAPALQAPATDPHMTPEERAHVVKLLEDSQKEYLSYLENVNEAQWTWKPAPDRWSVGQTAEHILLAETALFRGVESALAAAPNPDWQKATAGKTELLERVMPDRSHKATAPESVQPQAGLSKAEVIPSVSTRSAARPSGSPRKPRRPSRNTPGSIRSRSSKL